MNRPRLHWYALALLTVARVAASQQVDGSLEGRVLAPDGTPLPDANLVVQGSHSQLERRAASDTRGCFRIPGLPVGSYTISITHVGQVPTIT